MNRPATDLESRAGLPPELRYLVERHPRGLWGEKLDAAGMGTFWLQRHAMFRDMGARLGAIIGEYREDRLTAHEFARQFAPRLQVFLGELDGHHRVEDMHYFPVFARIESGLARGFAILDEDHHAIHAALERNAEAANVFLRALDGDDGDRRRGADGYALENARLVKMLTRHLDDEEDLVIPVIIERGEDALEA